MKTTIKGIALALCLSYAAPAFANHKTVEDVLAKCDKNKDGKISEAEFIESKKEHFKETDEDGDGALNNKEIQAMID